MKKAPEHKQNNSDQQKVIATSSDCSDLSGKRLEAAPLKFLQDADGQFKVIADLNLDEHPMNKAMGCKDLELAKELFLASFSAIASTVIDLETAMNVILQSINDSKPRDAMEARLAAQATLAYHHGLKNLEKSANAGTLGHIESYSNLAIKLMRVHNETVEVLGRYRRGGEQKVVVQHTVVAEKAVVNHFQQEGEPRSNQGDTPCS